MPNYQNSRLGIAALFCLVLWSAPAVAQRADSEQPLNLIGDAARSDRVTVAPEADEQPLEANADGDQPIAIDAGQSKMVPAADNSLAETSLAYAQVNIGRRKISEVGLAAIGVGDGDSSELGLDSMIWRGTSASDADVPRHIMLSKPRSFEPLSPTPIAANPTSEILRRPMFTCA